ncbi:MAG: Beta-glucosidase [Parcubacteria group bacterium GW2011_GWA2_38_13]|nr:MAG: Beta-glucosidase [Parcubacteria group bacterium GW2011_GWA2_38_13]
MAKINKKQIKKLLTPQGVNTRALRRSIRLKFHQTLYFPKDFFWGTSTSSHQVEGNNIFNDWWRWETQSKKRHHSGKACDQKKYFEKDFEMAKKMHQNAHRFSIEWSRIEPKEGCWDLEAVQYYKNIIRSLRKKHIEPFVTLHHFTNPAWFSRKGGWDCASSQFYFSRYVKFIVEELGHDVHYWMTINEPLVYSTMSYLAGLWPPEKKSYWLMLKSYRNLIRAHKKAYRLIHSIYKKKLWGKPSVGIASNSVSIYSYKKHSLFNWFFALISDWIWNHSFFTFSRRYHDFIGINYYFHYRVRGLHFQTLRFYLEARQEHREMTSVGWEVYPQGIFDVLVDLNSYKLPIFVTENGIATTNESKRSRYLISYLKEVYHAIQAGVDVRGYFYWSLIDNFEWEKGFEPRFGLIGINYRTMRRKPRHAALLYSKICENNSIPHSFLKYLGHSVR